MKIIRKYAGIDWILFFATMPLLAAGLISMRSFGGESDYYFTRQLVWIGIAFLFSSLSAWLIGVFYGSRNCSSDFLF